MQIKNFFFHNGYGIAFVGAGSCSFGNELVWNVVTFGVDNTLSVHSWNRKNNFLVLGKGPNTINDSVSTGEEMVCY